TSEAFAGQIYVPRVNLFLVLSVLLLVGIFRTSSALAGAYGIAVTGTMVVTAMLAFAVVWRRSPSRLIASLALILPLLFIPVTFSKSSRAAGCRWRSASF